MRAVVWWLAMGACLLACSPDPPETAPTAAVGDAASLSRDEIIRRFHQLWNEDLDTHFKNRFLGVSTLQNPLDVWITQELFFEVKPQVVVEAGTYHGGSALLWATLLAPVDPEAEVITIDIEDQREPLAKRHPLAHDKVTFLLGSSTDPAIVAEVARRVEGKRTMVILDSLHTAEHVYGELRAYAPLVSVGSYIIVQDTLAGPWAGIERFLQENRDFVSDKSRERLIISNNPGGFLRRIR